MPKFSKNTAADVIKTEGFKGDFLERDGYTVGFEIHTEDFDAPQLFKGLPDDRCQCPHWGVVLKGKLIWKYADGEDVITAGEAYYAKPGHIPVITAGTELVQFSPTAEVKKTSEVVTKNMQAMQG